MSQLDSGTFQQVKELVLSGYHLNDIPGLACPTTILPDGTTIASLERFALERFRFRGAMDTTSIDDFVRYSVAYAQEEEKARCFIDADNMLARSIFNIGTLDNPGHADNVASIKLKKTAPFRALLAINGDRLSQKQIAEWLEDWSDFLLAFDAEGQTMDISKAAQAVRRVTIQQTNQADHEDSDFAGRKSLMQSVEASSKDVMPVAFEFKCIPYEGLGERRFSLRNSLLKSGEPVFVLRIVQLEAQEEEMANEFRDLLIAQFDDKPVETFIGNFKA
ncbi:TPA: YfdQ family protein [Klebsiella pneumoniae]|nr:YfdQ family protein [Klebsiella pneumoniae]HBU2592547.1 YfdQ family protein [Klebsiella pneumoniae]HBU2775119.1 YfdQ family protein [Klebsiella pneumoniae]